MINNIRSPRQIRRIIYVIVAIGLFESLYGMLEYFSGRQHIFFYKKSTSFSVSGTFVNKNHFAGYMEMVIPLTFSILFVRLEERSQTSSKKLVRFFQEKYMKVLLLSFLLAIMIAAILLSGSRGGVVSFIGGILCLIILAYNRRLLRKRAVIVLLLFVISLGAAILIGYDLITTRLHTLTQLETELSFQLRRDIWKDTFSMFHDFLVFGSGLGTFSHIYPQYQSFVSELTIEYTENDYLQMLAETGIVGMIFVVCTGGIFFYTGLKAWKQRHSRWSIIVTAGGMSALVSLLVHSCIDFNLHIPSNSLLFSVIAALTYVTAHSQRRSLQ
jgi:O-antigen ligase